MDVSAEPKVEFLQQDVTSCKWDLEDLGVTAPALTATLEQVPAAPSIRVRRKCEGCEEQDDLRPTVIALTVLGPPAGGARLNVERGIQARGVRSSELLRKLCPDLVLDRGGRTHQWIERDGARREPLESGIPPMAAERAMHAWRHAS